MFAVMQQERACRWSGGSDLCELLSVAGLQNTQCKATLGALMAEDEISLSAQVDTPSFVCG